MDEIEVNWSSRLTLSDEELTVVKEILDDFGLADYNGYYGWEHAGSIIKSVQVKIDKAINQIHKAKKEDT